MSPHWMLGLSACAVLALAGCATGERVASDGVVEHQIVCGGYFIPWSACTSKAESICPAGFTLVSKEWSTTSGFNEMYVRCKGQQVGEQGP